MNSSRPICNWCRPVTPRICDDLQLDEIRDLAREMSYKYALFRLPRGGAKAGVRLAQGLDREGRLRALRDFGRDLGPIIRANLYNPGMDMNCGPDELRAIYRGAGIELGAITDTSWFTALSVFHALEACTQALGSEAGDVTLAIEGFGNVARHLAARLPPRYRIIGVSTVAGAVLRADGFDATQLVQWRDQHGDAFVRSAPGEQVNGETLLAADVAILVPAARTRSLTAAVADKIRARAIVPIANAPYADGVVGTLESRGVVCLPGYLVNVGGVLASSLYDQGVAKPVIEHLFAASYRDVVARILAAAQKQGIPAAEFAARLAAEQFPLRARLQHRSFLARVYRRFLHRRLPRRLRGELAQRRCAEDLAALRSEIATTGGGR